MNPLLRAALPYLVGAAVLAAAMLGVRWYGASQFRDGVAKANADHTLAELTEFKSQTARLGGISDTLEGALVALDAERLQHINEAGRMANAAGQPGTAVPAGAGGD